MLKFLLIIPFLMKEFSKLEINLISKAYIIFNFVSLIFNLLLGNLDLYLLEPLNTSSCMFSPSPSPSPTDFYGGGHDASRVSAIPG